MQRSIRHKLIIQSLQTSGLLRVEQLADLTGASQVTIRRDLVDLEAHGALRRVPGGAARTVKDGGAVPYSVRITEDREVKARLAAAVAGLIADYESVIIDNGTTCHAVAQELAGRPITALCLSLHAAVALGSTPGARVIIPGGPVEPDTLALLGSQAIDAVRSMRADALVIGACSASATRGLTSTLYEDALIKRASIESSTRRILVTVADKLNRTSNFRFGVPADLTHLVITDDASADLLALFREDGVEVITV
ncbi:MAG: DeoR/GlpR family DNA-binding transcription regulator [Propionicimonas sp.]|uniref:DeoR/GlpR family DNA-binding transcription regulator n=1 Tax=Propionicimonas sp. TaxID=1955623 RepID=UPI003D13DF13